MSVLRERRIPQIRVLLRQAEPPGPVAL